MGFVFEEGKHDCFCFIYIVPFAGREGGCKRYNATKCKASADSQLNSIDTSVHQSSVVSLLLRKRFKLMRKSATV